MEEDDKKDVSGKTNQVFYTALHEVWDTVHVPLRDRRAHYHEGVCRSFLNVTPRLLRNETVIARIDRVQLERGSIARINCSPHKLSRTLEDMRMMKEQHIGAHLHLSGTSHVLLNGKSHTTNRGDVVLYETTQPFDVHIQPDAFQSTQALFFTKPMLKNIIGSDFSVFRTLVREQPVASALCDCLMTIANRYSHSSLDELAALFDAALYLTAAGLVQDRDFLQASACGNITVRNGLLATIRSFVDHNLADPSLSPSSAASRFGISVRYLHKLFHDDRTTFSTYLLDCRLARVHSELLRASRSNMAVSEAVFRWGFRDLSSFHKKFKRRYGSTPKQVRGSRTPSAGLEV